MADNVKPRKSTKLSIPVGLYAYNHAILSDGRLSTLAIDKDFYSAWRTDPAAGSKVFKHAKAAIFTTDGTTEAEEASFKLPGPFPIHDKFPDGRWLVASTRTDKEPNGCIFSAQGVLVQRIMLGDGIEHMKIDDEGRIWVGWFDEGIFGNDDWKYASREWPPSSEGLACFDDKGSILWAETEAAKAAGLKSLTIADCYALNVAGNDVWASPYTDFPLLHAGIGKRSQLVWPTTLSGPRALAVRPPIVVCAGSYEKGRHEVVVLELKADKVSVRRRCQLAIEPDNPKALFLLDGRRDTLHLVQNGHWHTWNVADFV